MPQGNVDKLRSTLQKACDQLLTAAETLDAAIIEASAIGGQINNIIPPHIKTQIDKLTAIVDGNDQSALTKLDELILNMPYRDIAPSTSAERIRKGSNNIDLNPKSGPAQTAIKESLDSMYPRGRQESVYKGRGLSWNSLKESEIYKEGQRDDFGLSSFIDKPEDVFNHRQKIRETIENEDFEDLGEQLQESMDGKGHFNWRAMKSPMGSLGNTEFTSLVDTGKSGMNLEQIKIVN